jgi:hypothetical protein
MAARLLLEHSNGRKLHAYLRAPWQIRNRCEFGEKAIAEALLALLDADVVRA